MQAYLKTGKTGKLTTGKDASTSSTVVERKKRPTPWVEKYRPKNIEDVVQQAEVISVFRQCINGADLPNMLLYGPPGTGKTSTILAAARQLFGDQYKDRILELNASDERGINVVRTKIKNFAQLTATGVQLNGVSCPPFKIIILDEADSMTHAAQSALRRTMEKESRSTRFCLICNYVSRIIEPITSRCTKFRFKTLGDNEIIERLKYICGQENLKVSENAFKFIIKISGGDLRRAITILQSCYTLKGSSVEIQESDLFEVSGIMPDEYFMNFLKICQNGNYIKLEEFVQDITYEAHSIGQMLEQFNEFILNSNDISDKQKSLILDKLGECSFRLQEGGSEYLQIMDLGCAMIMALQNKS